MSANWLVDADERKYVGFVVVKVVKIGSVTVWVFNFQATVHKLQGRNLHRRERA
jgi:hypothetical protein